MEEPEKSRSFSLDDFRRYKNGEMSFEEQHSLEKQMLDNAFTAAAYEGFELLASQEINFKDVTGDLNRKLENRLDSDKKRLIPFWLYGAAASLVIGTGAIWMIFLADQKAAERSSTESVSLMKVPALPDENEQKEEIAPRAAPENSNPKPLAESKSEKNRNANSQSIENSSATEPSKEESLFAEAPLRQEQIRENKRNRIASAEREMPGQNAVSVIIPGSPKKPTDSAGQFRDETTRVAFSGIRSETVQDTESKSADLRQQEVQDTLVAAATSVKKEMPVVASSPAPAYNRNATPEKGWKHYQEYLGKNAGSAGINADVAVTFMLHGDGSLTDFSAKGNKQLHKRAIRIIKNGPAWPQTETGSSRPVEIIIHFRK